MISLTMLILLSIITLSLLLVCTQRMQLYVCLHIVSMSLFVIILHTILPLLTHSPSPLLLQQFIQFLLFFVARSNFSTIFNFGFVTFISNHDPNCRVLPLNVISSLEITQILFDSVINYLGPVSLSQGLRTLQRFIYESNPFSFSLANPIFPETYIHLIIFRHTLSSLLQQLSLPSTIPYSSSNILSKHSVYSIFIERFHTKQYRTESYRLAQYRTDWQSLTR